MGYMTVCSIVSIAKLNFKLFHEGYVTQKNHSMLLGCLLGSTSHNNNIGMNNIKLHNPP